MIFFWNNREIGVELWPPAAMYVLPPLSWDAASATDGGWVVRPRPAIVQLPVQTQLCNRFLNVLAMQVLPAANLLHTCDDIWFPVLQLMWRFSIYGFNIYRFNIFRDQNSEFRFFETVHSAYQKKCNMLTQEFKLYVNDYMISSVHIESQVIYDPTSFFFDRFIGESISHD